MTLFLGSRAHCFSSIFHFNLRSFRRRVMNIFMTFLKGKKALVIGVANERSLAWAITQSLHQQGAEIGMTFQGDLLERRVRPLAESVNASFLESCDVTNENDLNKLFKVLDQKWGQFDILIHSVAFADRKDLEGRFIDTNWEGFQKAIQISAYSLVNLARHAEPFMEKNGSGTILTLSYYGAEKVVPNYNVMGVAKATLEACVRYLAYDVGSKKIRVNAISAGPVKTLAAAGIRNFRTMLSEAKEKTPLRENIDPQDVGELAAFLCSDGGKSITGTTHYVDCGAHIMGV